MTTNPNWINYAIDHKYIQLYPHDDFINIRYGDSGGEGRFSRVASAECPRTNRKVALKKLKNFNLEKFEAEVRMHVSGHSSKNIVRFLGLTQEGTATTYIMVLEYADRNNLRTFLQKHTNLDWDVKVKLSLDIAKGLSYLHSLNIAHRDLHSNNVVINQVHHCKELEFIARITDFGSATVMNGPDSDGDDVNKVLGQIPFTDPKHLDDRKNYKKDLRSDIYSLGVVFWEISSNRPPFINYFPDFRGDFRDLCLTMEIISGYRERRMLLTPDEFVKLYKQCWDEEPSERPIIGEVIEALKKINLILTNSLEETMTIGQ
uniref:Serine/threonine-protein kinase HT1 n=1 Tax=Anthurium amnicola TaxID=1678845 RepID=A0A1D1XIE2_9ARAE